jgi:hypothetical protein
MQAANCSGGGDIQKLRLRAVKVVGYDVVWPRKQRENTERAKGVKGVFQRQ